MKDKHIKDCIYKQIRVPDVCRLFMDTPEFQRLRFIKQLGHAHYVYPSAVHTRFEHSLGVMHLAGKMVDVIAAQGNITQREKDLVQLAGMLHDLGHLAYSHFMDHIIAECLGDEAATTELAAHEDRSVANLLSMNERLAILNDDEVQFVRNCILGTPPDDDHRIYLYEIVNNRKCGVDVDKMDYLLRDAYHTGMHGFQSDYIIINTTIDADNHIAFAKKTRIDIKDLFATRKRMHKNVYQHHTVRKIERLYWCMTMQALSGEKADVINYIMNPLSPFQSDMKLESHLQSLFRLSTYLQMQEHHLDHFCPHCKTFTLGAHVPKSGSTEDVPFV